MFVPSMLLRQLYTFGSLKNTDDGVAFSIKNRLGDAEFTGLRSVRVAGRDVPLERVRIRHGDGEVRGSELVDSPLPFALRAQLDVLATTEPLPSGKHAVEIVFDSRPFGKLKLEVEDAISVQATRRVVVPRDADDDYSDAAIARRRAFVEEFTGTTPEHIYAQSFDPHLTQGNCELFTGVAQIPLGVAGPITVHGEHAQGEFLVPMATSEGTLVASYNRGIQVVNLSGGVRCTVVGDAMQRAPGVRVRRRPRRPRLRALGRGEPAEDPRGGGGHVERRQAQLRRPVPGQQVRLPPLQLHHRRRGRAEHGGRATFAACSWILDNYPGIRHFYLESNFATDKKASQVNIMRTRGKRVTAEATIKRDVLVERMRVEPEQLAYHAGVANVGRHDVGREQQRRALGQRDHRHLHRHRAGRGQRRRVVGGGDVRRAHQGRRPVPVDHDPVAHRRHARRRHRASHAARVAGDDGLHRARPGEQARRDHRRGGARRRAVARRRHLVERLGVEPRALRAQPVTRR
jgi:hydroxymethylglutaryl-CoA reductase (NADPH)